MRNVVQVVRFYLICKTTGPRSVESLLDKPDYNPLLKKCVDEIKRYPDASIQDCKYYRAQLDKGVFKFDSGSWAMDIREEDLPKGTTLEYLDLKNAFQAIIDWIKDNRTVFMKRLQLDEEFRNS
jgi:hypothetical protein